MSVEMVEVTIAVQRSVVEDATATIAIGTTPEGLVRREDAVVTMLGRMALAAVREEMRPPDRPFWWRRFSASRSA